MKTEVLESFMEKFKVISPGTGRTSLADVYKNRPVFTLRKTNGQLSAKMMTLLKIKQGSRLLFAKTSSKY